MDDQKNDKNLVNKKEDTRNNVQVSEVWTCTECGGHYLLMPVITTQEYSVDNGTGEEFWGDVDDSEPSGIFEDVKDGQTHAFCKTCNKETLCILKPFVPAKIPGPNFKKDVETQLNNYIKTGENVPEDLKV